MIGTGGGVLWLVIVLFALTLGLAGALVAAIRAEPTRMRAGGPPAGRPRRVP